VSDFDPQEKRLQHSLDSTVCSFDCHNVHINLIDTPGYADFLGKALTVLEAVEAVVVVVSAVSGVDSLTQRLMEFARDRELCRLVVVNKIDSKDARCEEVLGQLRENFGAECLPLNLPAGGGEAVVDCFFQPHGRAADFSSVEAAHTQIIDQVVELDEKLMSLYLEQGEEISPEQLHDPFEQALREGHLIPVCFASAEIRAPDAESDRGQSAALPQGHG
jgi:elongation factor G